ncbi:fumarate hydratase [Pedobacter frigiditerrae]|uniref:fumarate hydratase n=1 Tax=Pedobacter frigiditerrae TaxID=2530452 RepID=UPI00292DBCB7|nr:fumarate hydratase [Pedobacter frigiditerrae]
MMILFFKRNCFFALVFSLSAFALSCTRLPNVQGKGEALLQGVWNQDSIANSSKLLTYTQHRFKISCDSFYVDLTTVSKVNYYSDSCFNKGVWKEYAKGTYVVKGDTLMLTGTFTKDSYKQKVSGCYRTGRYLTNFKIKSSGANSLVLESLNDQRECALVLKEKITCVPKEL